MSIHDANSNKEPNPSKQPGTKVSTFWNL